MPAAHNHGRGRAGKISNFLKIAHPKAKSDCPHMAEICGDSRAYQMKPPRQHSATEAGPAMGREASLDTTIIDFQLSLQQWYLSSTATGAIAFNT
jgi:hypothetical protein